MPGLRYKHNYNYSCKCCHSATFWNEHRTRAAEKRQWRGEWELESGAPDRVALCTGDNLPCVCNSECPTGQRAGWVNIGP